MYTKNSPLHCGYENLGRYSMHSQVSSDAIAIASSCLTYTYYK